MAEKSFVHVIGGGVIGLTCALLLAKSGRYEVVLTARDLPADFDSQGFASPWAGAHWCSSCSESDVRGKRWDTVSYKKLASMIPAHPDLLMPVEAYHYFDDSSCPDCWFATLVPNYRCLRADEIPAPYKSGHHYQSLSFCTPRYLEWLESELARLGVKMTRRHLQSIGQAFSPVEGLGKSPSIVVNATGLGAKSLLGVQDELVEPIKGQTVLVRGPPGFNKTVMAGSTYIIPRTDGTVILGGCRLAGDWSLSPDPSLAETILSSAAKLAPELCISPDGSIPVIRHNVGLRPGRKGGPRLEKETVQLPSGGASEVGTRGGKKKQGTVVHAYGIDGSGYQSSWGMAEDVLKLADEHIAETKAAA